MEKKQILICDRCKVEMQEMDTQFSYLGRSFRHKVNRCPECGQVCLSEELVNDPKKGYGILIENLLDAAG